MKQKINKILLFLSIISLITGFATMHVYNNIAHIAIMIWMLLIMILLIINAKS